MRRLIATTLLALALAPVAVADGAGTLTPTTTGFVWTRSGLRYDLVKGDTLWSCVEADLVRQALDKIPDVYLRKAQRVGVHTFRRDGHPLGLTGPRPANVIATTVAEKGYVSFGSPMFDNGAAQVYQTTIHELGHCVQNGLLSTNGWVAGVLMNTVGTPCWSSISWTSVITDGMKSWNGFVSDYARKNDREDFAETAEFYWINPEGLRQVSPTKFAFMRDRIFEGQLSPEAARDLEHKVIDRVVPAVERLGDQVDDQYALVKVHGQRFMGPLDGGWNTVRYRGTSALHMPVSRTTIWSWVPGISTGQAPVTVTTQDGRSNAVDFRVTKPWWKFW